MKNLTTFSQLEAKFKINNFVEKTIIQINKDLNGLIEEVLIFNIEKSDKKLRELKIELVPILEKLSKNSQLQQYIYQVDLNENNWLNFSTNQNFNELAEQIIIREAQKVYLKEIFRK